MQKNDSYKCLKSRRSTLRAGPWSLVFASKRLRRRFKGAERLQTALRELLHTDRLVSVHI